MLFPKLRGEIAAQEYSHPEFAEKIGIGKTALSERLNGHKQWRLCEMYAALDVLGIPHERLPEYFPPIPAAVRQKEVIKRDTHTAGRVGR